MSDSETKIDHGGYAFPDVMGAGGMTFRQYAATNAMVGLLTSTGHDTQSIALYQTALESGQSFEQVVAKRSVDCADALIAELNKPRA